MVVSSAFVGKYLCKKMILRDAFFKDMLLLTEKLKGNIIFKQDVIKNVFNDFLSSISDINEKKRFSLIFDKYASGNVNEIENAKELSFLSKEEKTLLIRFFLGLGAGNSEVELGNIEGASSEIKNFSSRAEDYRKKNEGLYYKLSIAVGLVLSIIII